MIREYVESNPRKVLAVQWFPDQDIPTSKEFHPIVKEINGKHFLVHTTGYKTLLKPGWYITYDGPILEYEAWSEEEFGKEFVATTRIHENGKTVV